MAARRSWWRRPFLLRNSPRWRHGFRWPEAAPGSLACNQRRRGGVLTDVFTAVCDPCPRGGCGQAEEVVDEQVLFSWPGAAGFCRPCRRWRGRAFAGGGGVLVGSYRCGCRPQQVADAGDVELDADGEPVDVD